MARCSFAISFATSLLFVLLLAIPVRSALAQQGPDQSCLSAGCHENKAGLAFTQHGAGSNPRAPAGGGATSCTACHGSNPNHASDPMKNPQPNKFGPKAPAAAQTAVCMTCHAGNRHLAFWESGKHQLNDVSCNACHSVHGTPGPGATMAFTAPNPTVAPYTTTIRTLEYDTCSNCHKQIRSQILKPSHHPIVEGKLKCSDCHNPHGAMSHAMVKSESVNQLCTTCHADKRGPYMYEHPPVEENCLTCHNSHGSQHNKLLNEKVPNICQDCHDWSRHPGTAYTGSSAFPPAGNANTRFVARACVNCHYSIHGSNAPANRGLFFTR